MNQSTTYQNLNTKEYSILDDLSLLVKMRLTSMVVFTSVVAYALAAGFNFSWIMITLFALGGFLVTAAANVLNQVLEKDYDAKMQRTSNRPLAAGRMTTSTAVMIAGFCSLAGVMLLSVFNPLTGLLGMMSLILYAFVYTPLKRHSSIAVTVGAIPGALPMMIGCVAVDGYISNLAIGLFIIQFLWQYPHFWSIANVSFEDYKKAGYDFIPGIGELDDSAKWQSLIAAIVLIVWSFVMVPLIGLSVIPTIMLVVSALAYAWLSWVFLSDSNRRNSLTLMFSSFIYLPVVLAIVVLNALMF